MVAHSRAPLRTDRLRALNVPVSVAVDLDGDGLPIGIRDADHGTRRIAAVRERWRIDDEWWRHPIARRYCEVVLEDGRRVVLFQDLTSGDWFTQQP